MSKKPKIKYPFRRVSPAAELGKADIVSLARKEIAAGRGKPKRPIPNAFLDSERRTAAIEPKKSGFSPPKWLYAMVEQKASPKEIVEAVITRLRRAPSEKTLRAAQQILNELARREGGSFLRRAITQELVNEFEAKEKP